MSRIGKKPIDIPENVTAVVSEGKVEVKGPNGAREFIASKEVVVELTKDQIIVKPVNLSKKNYNVLIYKLTDNRPEINEFENTLKSPSGEPTVGSGNFAVKK